MEFVVSICSGIPGMFLTFKEKVVSVIAAEKLNCSKP